MRLRFAEILNPDGSIYTKNLRNADATDSYTLRGEGQEAFAPLLTFHGFRCVEVTGYPGTPTLSDLSGQVVSSLNQEPAGRLSTSSELVNRMWKLGIWGQRGNFLSVPTDCPQRDERLGWMADPAVFWRTGSYNFDIAAFTHKWMRDVDDAQSKEGAFSNVSPSIGVGTVEGAPGWGDAGVIVPWTTWMQYGDRRVIEDNWEPMKRWMSLSKRRILALFEKTELDLTLPTGSLPTRRRRKTWSTRHIALIAKMMMQIAEKTGKTDDAKQYEAVYAHIRDAFQKTYVKDDGTIASGSQTYYVVALAMGLVPQKAPGARRRKPGEKYRATQLAFDHWLFGHAVSLIDAGRSWTNATRLSPVAYRDVSIVGLHAAEGRHHLVGTMEWRYRRPGHELI